MGIVSSCYICGEDLLRGLKPFRPIQVVGCRQCLNLSQVTWEGEEATVQALPEFESLGNMAPRGSVISGIFEIVPQAITDLPVLAEIPQRVVSTIHDPISSIGDVTKIIEEDVVLSTKILSLANSAYFATPSEINDLQTACSRLGMKALANIANTMASAEQYKTSDVVARKLLQSLWQHAIVTAHCADAIANKVGVQSPNIFLAGLLHDIGKVVLVDVIMSKYTGPVGRLKEAPEVLAKAIAPFSPIVGMHVVQQWRLSPELYFSTLYADRPALTPHSEYMSEVYCISLASDIAESKGYGIGNAEEMNLEGHPAVAALGIDQSDLSEMVGSLEEMLDSVLGVLGALD